MFGEKALELLRELKRSREGTLPPYNEDGIRQVIEEMRALFEQNQLEVRATTDGEQGLFSGIQLRHACLERNQRCLLAYVFNRMMQIRDYRWEVGSVLPPEFKLSLCEQEVQWSNRYNRSLATYMRSIGDSGLDLTQCMHPPKSHYIEVRCLVDYGEFETEDGTIIQLKKNSQHYLSRSQCEQLVKQGILEHVQWWECATTLMRITFCCSSMIVVTMNRVGFMRIVDKEMKLVCIIFSFASTHFVII